MSRIIHLNAKRLETEADMTAYMHEIVKFPAHGIKNLNSLYEYLYRYQDDILIFLSMDCVHELCNNEYGFRVLMTLGKCAEANPHLQVQFDTEDK